MNLLEKILNIPTSVISLVLILTISVPMFYPLGLPITISPMVKATYNAIDQLPEGSVVLMDYGLTPASVAETGCGGRAMIHHMFSKGLKVIFIGGGVDSPMFVEKDVPPIAERLGREYGTDWVHLGYYAGGETGRAALLADLNNIYPKDHRGNLLQDLELMKDINNYESVDLVAIVTTGSDVVPMWIRQASTPYGINIIASLDGASFSIGVPYYPTQVSGMLNALRGGAEYEALMKRPGEAISGMDSISLSFLYVILLLVITNVALFLEKKEGT